MLYCRILFSYTIPISLFVTMEIIKFALVSLFLSVWDLRLLWGSLLVIRDICHYFSQQSPHTAVQSSQPVTTFFRACQAWFWRQQPLTSMRECFDYVIMTRQTLKAIVLFDRIKSIVIHVLSTRHPPKKELVRPSSKPTCCHSKFFFCA